MSLTNTTLAASCTASAKRLSLTSTSSGFPAVGTLGTRQIIRVGGEYMMLDSVVASGVIDVLMRGYNGTVATFHELLTEVSTSATPSDFGDTPVGYVNNPSPWQDDLLTIGEDLTFTAAGTAVISGTSIPLPIKPTTYYINKASAASITLISGTAAQAGLRIRFVAQTAAAHTIDYSAGFLGDGSSSNLATSVAKVGSTFDIVCGPTGLWGPVNASTNASTANWTLG